MTEAKEAQELELQIDISAQNPIKDRVLFDCLVAKCSNLKALMATCRDFGLQV